MYTLCRPRVARQLMRKHVRWNARAEAVEQGRLGGSADEDEGVSA